MAAKAKRVGEGAGHGTGARLMRRVVQITIGVRILEVDGRRDLVVRDSKGADCGLKRAARAEQVAVHGLGG